MKRYINIQFLTTAVINLMMVTSVLSISIAIVILSKHIHDNEEEHYEFVKQIQQNKERIKSLEQEVELYKTGNDV